MEKYLLVLSLLCVSSVYTDTNVTYPNPLSGSVACGQNIPSFICDPYHILDETQIMKLNRTVASLKYIEQCLCHHKDNCKPNTEHLVLVAVAPVVGVEYNYEQPQLAVNAFAEKLYTDWTTDSFQCKMVLVMVYDAKHKVIAANMNKFGKRVLTRLNDVIQSAKEEYFKNGKTFEGLQEIIDYCTNALYSGIPVHTFNLWTALGLPIVVSIPIILFCSLCWICILTCGNRN